MREIHIAPHLTASDVTAAAACSNVAAPGQRASSLRGATDGTASGYQKEIAHKFYIFRVCDFHLPNIPSQTD